MVIWLAWAHTAKVADAAEGSVALVRTATLDGGVTAQLYGLFGDDLQGYVAASYCAVGIGVPGCVRSVPRFEGDVVEVDAGDSFDPGASTLFGVGPSVQVGPYVSRRRAWPGGLVAYADHVGGFGPFAGAASVRLGRLVDVARIEVDPPLRMLEPDPLLPFEWRPGDHVTYRWVPGGAGEIFLIVYATDRFVVMYLDDDGEYTLEVDDLGLASDQPIQHYLSRWSYSTQEIGPHTVTLFVTWDNRMQGRYRP